MPLHEKRCETCANKREIITNDKGMRPWPEEKTLFLGYKCKITGRWCDERYETTQQINEVGCASHVVDIS